MSFTNFNPVNLQRKIEQILGLNVTSKQFSQVMSEIQLERKIAIAKKGVIVAYPFGSRIYNMTPSGQVTVDFNQGFVKFAEGADPSTAELNGSLEKCRSLLLFVNDVDAIITIDGCQLINDHDLWHLLEDVDITKLSITFPSNTNIFPNQFNFALVASDKPSMSYKTNLFVSHDFIRDPSRGTTGSRVTTALRHVAAYGYIIISTENEGSTNTVNIFVEYSADSVNWIPVSGYNPLVLGTNSTDTLTITAPAHFYRVQISQNVASEDVTTSLQAFR